MNILNSVLPITYNQLIDFANKNNFWQVFDTAFGTQYNRSLAEILRLQWETGDFSQLPQIEVLDSSILGSANGAYASSENRIYLSNTFVAGASLAAISGVLLEEIGHFVDAKINQTDSAGDEGAIFAELVQGYSLNTQTLQALKSEDDHATITVNGEVIQVEQQNFTGTAGNDTIIGTTSNDFIYGLAGDDTINTGLGASDFADGGAGDDLLIVDYSIDDTGRGMTLSTGVTTEGFQGTAYRLNAAGNATLDRVDFSGINRFQVTGTSQNDNINTASGNDTINSGAGDDNIDAGEGNNTINAGDGNDTIDAGGIGNDTIDGGAGVDNLTLNLSAQTGNIVINNATTGINLTGIVTATNFENFTITTGSGNDTFNQSGLVNNIIVKSKDDFRTGAGNDTINTGLGDSDFADGGAGDDLLIVDYSIGDTGRGMTLSTGVTTEGFQGTAYRLNAAGNATLDRVDFSGINRFQVTGTSQNDNINTASGNDTINSGAGDDNIDAGAGDDNIDGVNGASLTPGLGEIDSLTGGTGSDRFILGNATKVYYDDANTLTNGSSDYANINDFNIANGDIIQLQGTSSNYLLAVVGADTQILINKPNTEPDELIGIVRNQTGLSLTGTYFSYVFDNTPPTNQAPTNITLNNSTIAENQPINTKIGNFTTIDPDAGNTFTYTLVSGTGDTDNNVFTITNNELKTNSGFDYETKNSYSIRIKTTDQGGLSFEKQLTIGVTDVNETPTNISLNNSTIAENQAINTVVGNFTITDPDTANTFTYTLVSGTGDTDNNVFTITNNELKTNSGFDYETKNSYSIRIKTTDQGGLSFEKQLTIGVTDVNEVPVITSPTTANFAENGTGIVYTAIATDVDAGTPLYSLSGTDASLFNISNGNVNFKNAPNFELPSDSGANNVYDINVIASDGSLTATQAVAIAVTNVNEVPSNLTLSNSTIAENQPINTVVGNFTTTDPDEGNTFTYTLVSGTGDTDNNVFTITNNELKTKAVFDYETKNSYSIRVKTTDQGGLSFEKQLTIGVTDVNDRTLTPITDYAPNVNISTGLIFSTNGGGNLSLDTNRLSASNEVTGVQNGTKSNFNHLFGLYEVVDAEGGINTEKGVLKPGDSDYAFYALTTARVKDFIVQAGSGDTPSTATQLGSGVSLQGNKFYAPFVIANCGTYFPNLQQGVEDFVAAENGDVNRFANALQYVRDLVATEAGNEFNNAPRFVQEPVAYFSFGSANPDKSPHLRSYGNGVYGFEDLPATATQYSNNDFNDAVFALS
jgi:Ca2+-binding RTX toxin-like protein